MRRRLLPVLAVAAAFAHRKHRLDEADRRFPAPTGRRMKRFGLQWGHSA